MQKHDSKKPLFKRIKILITLLTWRVVQNIFIYFFITQTFEGSQKPFSR